MKTYAARYGGVSLAVIFVVVVLLLATSTVIAHGPFAITYGTIVQNGVPGPGAGNISAAAESDTYTFDGIAGEIFIFQEISAASANFRYRLESPTVQLVFDNYSSTQVPLTETGTYTITVRDNAGTATGDYSFQILLGDTPDGPFAISYNDVISTNVPSAGAGNIEAAAGSDVYTFSATSGDKLIFQELSAASANFKYLLQSPTVQTVFDLYSSTQVDLSQTGTYTLTVRDGSSPQLSTGSYSFQLLLGDTPDGPFAITYGTTVSNGVPAAGAGNIEAAAASDVYTFTGNAGDTLIFQEISAGSANFRYLLQSPTVQTVFDLYGSTQVVLSETGTHTLTVRDGSTPQVATGAYSFQILLGDSPPDGPFAINYATAVSNGVPAAGAGNIEAAASIDIYTFSGSAGDRIIFQEVSAASANFRYRLESPTNQVLFDNYSSIETVLTETGTHTLTVRDGSTPQLATGTYSFSIYKGETQTFVIGIGTKVSQDSPETGAGNLEAPGSMDVYTFPVTAGQSIDFDVISGSGNIDWILTAPSSAVIFDDAAWNDVTQTLNETGTYTLAVDDPLFGTGPYEFQMRISVPQAPVAGNDYFFVNGATLVRNKFNGVLRNDYDANGQSLTASIVSPPIHAQDFIFRLDGSFDYTPQYGYTGSDSFTYKISDGALESNVATVTITINAPVTGGPTPTGPTPTPDPVISDEPESLDVSGDVDEDTVLPTFNFQLPLDDEGQVAGVEWFEIVVADSSGQIVLTQWYPVGQFCQAERCAFTPDETLLPVGLLSGAYTWKVRTWGPEVGISGYAENGFAIDVDPPGVPSDIQVDTSSGDVVISWINDKSAAWFQIIVAKENGELIYDNWHNKRTITCDSARCSFALPSNPSEDLRLISANPGLRNGDYTLRMRAWGAGGFNGDDDPDASSDPIPFVINVSLPGLAQIPADWGITNTATGSPTFRWTPAENATWQLLYIGSPIVENGPPSVTYHIKWYRVSDMDCPNGKTDPCLFSPDDVFLSVGIYEYWILSWGPAGQSQSGEFLGWVKGGSFEVNVELPEPALPMTPTGITTTSSPMFQWDHVPTTTWYRVWVGQHNEETNVYTNNIDQWFRARNIGCTEPQGICTTRPENVYLPPGNYVWFIQSYNPAYDPSNIIWSTVAGAFEIQN